jgi:hypothetical protein
MGTTGRSSHNFQGYEEFDFGGWGGRREMKLDVKRMKNVMRTLDRGLAVLSYQKRSCLEVYENIFEVLF